MRQSFLYKSNALLKIKSVIFFETFIHIFLYIIIMTEISHTSLSEEQQK